MTKKDFKLIANIMSKAKPNEKAGQAALYLWHSTCVAFADQLALTNPRFNGSKFLLACGTVREPFHHEQRHRERNHHVA